MATATIYQPLYQPHPKQQQALELLGLADLDHWRDAKKPVEELLVGGAAGGGKSYLLRCIAVTLCSIWPGSTICVMRRTYPELEESHIRWIQEEVPPELARYNSGRRELLFKNGSLLEFRHADEEKAVYRYNTAEWSALLIDQAEAFSEFMLRFLRSRVRQPKIDPKWHWRTVIVYSANPGGLSHLYLRDGFVNAASPGIRFMAPTSDGGLRRCFLPARLSDNPSLDASEYRRRLQGLPEHLVQAYLEGDWSGVVGSYFSQWRAYTADGDPWHVWDEGFARAHYAIEDDEPFPPEHWLRWCGVDGGFHDPWCVLWLARAPDGRVFVYHEQYGVGIQIDEQARQVVDAALDGKGVPHVIVCDPAMMRLRANFRMLGITVTDAMTYGRFGVRLTPASNQRVPGWRRISENLSRVLDDGLPALVVLEGAAPQLTRTLPSLLIDPIRHEDVSDEHGRADPRSPSSVRDDPADSLRYALMPAMAPVYSGERIEIVSRHSPNQIVEFSPDAVAYDLGQTGIRSEW